MYRYNGSQPSGVFFAYGTQAQPQASLYDRLDQKMTRFNEWIDSKHGSNCYCRQPSGCKCPPIDYSHRSVGEVLDQASEADPLVRAVTGLFRK